MQAIAQFEKVSYEQFNQDVQALFPEKGFTRAQTAAAYEGIALPRRATQGAAGYDLAVPFQMRLAPGQSVVIPTGLRCRIDPGWVLFILPRSGLGFRYRLQLDNTAGVIDSDYYGAENQGHILVKAHYAAQAQPALTLEAGERFTQGLFLPYGVCLGDEPGEKRTGGFGSTGQKA